MEENKAESGPIQYIVVRIEDEQYGFDIKYVDNIVRMQKITRVPKAQHYFRGVINLRGEIVPVMSIRTKMGLCEDEFTNETRIIILEPEQQGAVGVIVDEVREVVTLEDADVDRQMCVSAEGRSSFINGVGKHNDELISLFDIGAVISD